MLRESKSGLRLNSYKLDTQSLQNSIRELSEKKSELETTISYYKSHEDRLALENDRLKQEIAMLHSKVLEKPDHSQCHAKAMQQEKLLQDSRIQYQKLTTLFQEQKNRQAEVTRKCEQQLLAQAKKHNQELQESQQQIGSLSRQVQLLQLQEQNNNIVIRNLNSRVEALTKDTNAQNVQKYQAQINQRQVNMQPHWSQPTGRNSYKDNTNLAVPAKTPAAKMGNESTGQRYSSGSREQEVSFEINTSYAPSRDHHEGAIATFIRSLAQEIKDLGLSPREASVLPLFKKMSNNSAPTPTDIQMFLKNLPNRCQEQQTLQIMFSSLVKSEGEQHSHMSGKQVTEFIVKKLEELEQVSRVSSSNLQISGVTSEEYLQGSGASQEPRYSPRGLDSANSPAGRSSGWNSKLQIESKHQLR